MSSLQDQLLKAGLTTKHKANKVKQSKTKANKVNRKHKQEVVDETKVAAEKAAAEQAERSRQLNMERQVIAEEKAIAAQIKQIIDVNQQSRGKPIVSYKFSDQGMVKSIEVANDIHKHLTKGLLAIVKKDEDYALVPKVIAEKINQRSEGIVVLLNEKSVETRDDDDPYAEFEIPDDLMW